MKKLKKCRTKVDKPYSNKAKFHTMLACMLKGLGNELVIFTYYVNIAVHNKLSVLFHGELPSSELIPHCCQLWRDVTMRFLISILPLFLFVISPLRQLLFISSLFH